MYAPFKYSFHAFTSDHCMRSDVSFKVCWEKWAIEIVCTHVLFFMYGRPHLSFFTHRPTPSKHSYPYVFSGYFSPDTSPLSPCGCYKKILSERLPSLKPYEITKPRKKSRIFYQAIFNMWFFQAYFSLQKMSVFKSILPHFFFSKRDLALISFPKTCHWYSKKSITKTIHSTTIFSNKRTLILYINSQHDSTFSNPYTYGFICHFHLCYNFRQHR